MLLNNGIAIFIILFIKDLYAQSLNEDVASFFNHDEKISHNSRADHRIPDRILKLIESKPKSVQNLFENSNFSNATVDDMIYLYPTVFYYIPNEKLANVSSKELAKLLDHFSNDVYLATKILQTLKNNRKLIEFLSQLTGDNLNQDIVRTISEDLIKLSMSDENALDLLRQNRWLLLGSPPSFLLNLKPVYKTFLFFYVHFMGPVLGANKFWDHSHQLTKRTWSKLIVESNDAFLRLKQEYIFINIRHTLEGMDLPETKRFLASNSENLQLLQSVNWNAVQIRIISQQLEKFNNSLVEEFQIGFLPQLLPNQIQLIRQEQLQNALLNLQTSDGLSLPVAIQLFEYLLAWNNNPLKISSLIADANSELVGKLLFSQSITVLSKMCEDSLPFDLVAKLDSEKYSFLQAYYILNHDKLRSNKDNLLTIKELLMAVPASFFKNFLETFKVVQELHLAHVLQYSPPGNRIKAMALLELYLTSGYTEYIENALSNKDNEFIFLISPLEISKNADEIMEIIRKKGEGDNQFARRAANLPDYVLIELLRKVENITYDNLFDDSYPLHMVITGLSCEILAKIPSSDFLPIFGFYNRQRKLFDKKFPKSLQNCAKEAYLSYLRDKSVPFTTAGDGDLMQFIELEDIRSIGGYVLTTLPVNVALKSEHSVYILQEIGRLSLPELMLAAKRDYLVSLTSEYLKKEFAEKDIGLDCLLRLGNLIHFLDDTHLGKVDAQALRFILEAEAIDTRICAASATRKIWETKLINAFGSLERWDEDMVLKVGDMLIAISPSSLRSIRSTVRLNIADLMKSRYNDDIEWIPSYLPFYEVCCVTFSNEEERSSYESSLRHLAIFYAISIEHQLQSVLRARDIPKEIPDQQFTKFPKAFYSSETPTKKVGDGLSTEGQLENLASNLSGNLQNETLTIDAKSAEEIGKGEPLVVTVINRMLAPFQNSASESNLPKSSFILATTFSNTSMVSNTSPSSKEPQLLFKTTAMLKGPEPEIQIPTSTIQSIASTSPNTTPDVISPNTNQFTVSDGHISQSSTISQSNTVEEREKPQTHLNEEEKNPTLATSGTSITDFLQMSNLNVTVPAVGALDSTSYATISSTESAMKPTFSLTQSPFTEYELNTINVSSKINFFSIQTTNTTPYDIQDEGNQAIATTNKFAYDLNAESDPSRVTNVTPDRSMVVTSFVEPSNSATVFSNTTSFNTDSKKSNSPSTPSQNASNLNSGISHTKKETRSVELYEYMKPSTDSEIGIEDDMQLSLEVKKLIKHLVNNNYTTQNSNYRRKRGIDMELHENIEISCNTLKILGSMSKFVIPSLNMTEEDYFNCIELFGRLNLDNEMRNEVWYKVKSNKVLDSNLIFVAGKILSVITEEDSKHIDYNLHSEWALESINSLSENVKDGLHEEMVIKFLRQNPRYHAKKTLPSSAILALGKLICKLPDSMLHKILKEPHAFSRNWLVFRTLNHCPMDCLKKIAKEAVEKFGEPQNWKPSLFTTVGPVAAGLFEIYEEWNFTRHLDISAIECLSFESVTKLINEKRNENIPHDLMMFLMNRKNQACLTKGLLCSPTLSSTEMTSNRENSFESKENIRQTSNQNLLRPSSFLLGILILRFLL